MGSKSENSYVQFSGKNLGTIQFNPRNFSGGVISEIESKSLKTLPIFEKHRRVSEILFEKIQNAEEGFLLPSVIGCIAEVRSILPTYTFLSFEFWLNNYANCSEKEKLKVRAKIVGKAVPKSAYHKFFPVKGKGDFAGPHFSLAHFSPDIDTTVASFACYLNAFGAKIARARHHWILPEGPPQNSCEIDFIFRGALGDNVFSVLATMDKRLSISSLDLLTQENLIYKKPSELSYESDYERMKQATVLLNEEGCYVGDWREIDVELVRGVISRFHMMLREHRNEVMQELIGLFAKRTLNEKDSESLIQSLLHQKLSDCKVNCEFTAKQREMLDRFLKEVLGVKAGYEVTFNGFVDGLKGRFGYEEYRSALRELEKTAPELSLDREKLFVVLEKVVSRELEAHAALVKHLDSLDVALSIKQKVFGYIPQYVSHLAEYDEVLQEIKECRHIAVNYEDQGKLYTLGVIHADELKQKSVATCSLNDFSHLGESDVRSDVIDVISFIDHHKSKIATTRAITGTLLDAESSNSIVASLTFELNDKYSLGGMTLEKIEEEIRKFQILADTPSHIRILERLLQRKRAAMSSLGSYIAYDREFLEYLQFLVAILDDTDLLTKVTEYDVDVVASLLNRLKSMMLREEVEVVHFDDLIRNDPDFLFKASKRLLETSDLYSIYSVIHRKKEALLSDLIIETAKGKETPFFQDTKSLGGGNAVVSQFKHFTNNQPILRKHIAQIRKVWIERCDKMQQEMNTPSLFILMLSTVSSAEELFSGVPPSHHYKDELWFYVPLETKKGMHLLRGFLREFIKAPLIKKQDLEVEFLGQSRTYESAFKESIHREYRQMHTKFEAPMAIIKVDQQSVKSRKADIAPYF